MKKTLLITFALLVVTALHAQYFSTNEGAELVYVNYDSAGQSTSTETVTVKSVTKERGAVSAVYMDKIVNQKSKNNTSYTRYLWTYSDGTTTCTEDLMYGPYIDGDSDPDIYNEEIMEALKSDCKFKGDNSFTLLDGIYGGESIADRSYSYTSNMLKNEITISGASYLAPEMVSTTAGNFTCLKVSFLQQTKITVRKETIRVNEWYAKGIGLVKREVYNTKGALKSKTVITKITEK